MDNSHIILSPFYILLFDTMFEDYKFILSKYKKTTFLLLPIKIKI